MEISRPGAGQETESAPHFLFVLPKRKRAAAGPKEKDAFFLTNQENPGHATGPSAAFALVVAAPPLSALPASLRAGAVDSEPLASAAAGAV